MKKVLVLSFIALFIANIFELHQLAKLPALVHHFFEHKNENQYQSFTEFLADHYFEHHDHASQHHRHDDLPYKSSNCSSFHSTIVFFQSINNNINQPSFSFIALIKESQPDIYVLNLVGKIWQPPKI